MKKSNHVKYLKMISILQDEALLLMLFCEGVLKQREHIQHMVKLYIIFWGGQFVLQFFMQIAFLKTF